MVKRDLKLCSVCVWCTGGSNLATDYDEEWWRTSNYVEWKPRIRQSMLKNRANLCQPSRACAVPGGLINSQVTPDSGSPPVLPRRGLFPEVALMDLCTPRCPAPVPVLLEWAGLGAAGPPCCPPPWPGAMARSERELPLLLPSLSSWNKNWNREIDIKYSSLLVYHHLHHCFFCLARDRMHSSHQTSVASMIPPLHC